MVSDIIFPISMYIQSLKCLAVFPELDSNALNSHLTFT